MSIREQLKPVHAINVIRTYNKVVGAGTDDDPVREVVQYWTTEGELLDECDSFLMEQARKMGKTGQKIPTHTH